MARGNPPHSDFAYEIQWPYYFSKADDGPILQIFSTLSNFRQNIFFAKFSAFHNLS